MWDSHRPRRISVVIPFLVLILSTTCKHSGNTMGKTGYTESPVTSSSPAGVTACAQPPVNKKAPQVCVEDNGMPVPPTALSWDRTGEHFWNRRVTLTFRAANPAATLDVTFHSNTCVDNTEKVCHGHECTAKLRVIDWDLIDPGKPKKDKTLDCKYKTTITLPDGTQYDPEGDVVVNPCCW